MFDMLHAAQAAGQWTGFPFGPGLAGSWLLAICKFLFIGLVLALIMWILRRVFGPGGFLRDRELDREAAEERQNRREARMVLEQRLARGEISPEDYTKRKETLEG
ncbi:MAG: SHOCT domain-containing protein [Desulfohalobiaceae bacterium]|nr:SHOCT domain-containing protein [Desulfohalobiaceae bacterium]